ncbi:MAG: hypothetical protein U1E27_00910 [Kiritimatiellia bacterium]|nr:hypothetical protein [Kiritimatiellia bacterium]
MPAVNEGIVREYFEALGFLVLQPHKYVVQARAKRPEEEIDFVVFNPLVSGQVLPESTLWTSQELRRITRAVVSVRGWHTDRFSPAMLEDAPEIFRFADPATVSRAEEMLGGGPVARILCVPALPVSMEARARALAMFRERGVDGVLPFRTLLIELIARIDVNSNYEKSDLLQALRILKNYDLLKDAQLEMFSGLRAGSALRRLRRSRPKPKIDLSSEITEKAAKTPGGSPE